MVASGNVGLAFGLVCAAGLSTTIGASVVFCASLAQPRLLALSLGFAAGVMVYVSFAEIFLRKSVSGFEAVNLDGDAAYRYSTLCFFGGMLFIAILDQIVHLIADCAGRRSRRRAAQRSVSTANLLGSDVPSSVLELEAAEGAGCGAEGGAAAEAEAAAVRPPEQQRIRGGGGSGGAGGLARAASKGDLESSSGAAADGASSDDAGDVAPAVARAVGEGGVGEELAQRDALQLAAVQEQAAQSGTTSRQPPAVVEIMKNDHHNFALQKMGVLTGIAIFIHNFPEGLATFVGALADTSVGVGIAVAIAMHNIPEGICVAMPIYYATGSKTKGFVWALLSGVSEPIGGLVGYLALQGDNDLAFAIVFGLVAGMMVYISVRELIPTALKYDPHDKVVTKAVIAGMVVMAGSLLLFTI